MSKKTLETLQPMEIGEVSEPLVISRAVMVLKLEQKEDAHVEDMEEVRDQVYQALWRERMDEELGKYLKKLWSENQILVTTKYETDYPTGTYR
jgi:parvulin-like peptidyl-prolyl isomerase